MRFPNCPNAEISNFFSMDKSCKCGWGKADDENMLNLSDKIEVDDLICPICKTESYYKYPLIHCKSINQICLEYDCDSYK